MMLHLRPHRSLTPRGAARFVTLTGALLLVPLLAVVGSPVLWGLLPFLLAALWALTKALAASFRTVEDRLTFTPEEITLTRVTPGKPDRVWRAHPSFVQLHVKAQPMPCYITLTGGGREVEVGSFLTEAERRALVPTLRERIAAVRA